MDTDKTIADALTSRVDGIEADVVRKEAVDFQKAAQFAVDVKGKSTKVTQQINEQAVGRTASELYRACVFAGFAQ